MKAKNKKTINPSQRDSVTPYTEYYGGVADFEHRQKTKKKIRIAVYILVVILLIYIGYFFTDTLIKITELPL